MPLDVPVEHEAPLGDPVEEDDDVANLLEAEEWLADGDGEPESDKPATAKEADSSKEAWKRWMELVEGDQDMWRKEAES